MSEDEIDLPVIIGDDIEVVQPSWEQAPTIIDDWASVNAWIEHTLDGGEA